MSTRVWRALALGCLLWALASSALHYRRWANERHVHALAPLVAPPAEAPAMPERELLAARFLDLPGWSEDDQAAALPALQRTCRRFAVFADGHVLEPREVGGTVADWRGLCAGLFEVSGRWRPGAADAAAVRAVLERETVPVKVRGSGRAVGLFTGYYEPRLRGSRRRSAAYPVPLYRNPGDQVPIELGDFRPDLAGQKIVGRYRHGRLEPYPDRGQIARGAFAGQGLELVYLDDPIDAFFLQVQGSGRVELAEGGELRVGYGGQTGHPYTAIGRELIARGVLAPAEVTMQSIRAYLEQHPEERETILDTNRSYVFFRLVEKEGPFGSHGVALTAGRSLAVDRRFVPLGVPLWLATEVPEPGARAPEPALRPWRRLMVAQDTGGAIRGAVRGDVYFGSGDEAGEVAGRMKRPGRYWLLLPRAVAERALAEQARSPIE